MERKITIASVVATFALIEATFIMNPAMGLLAAAHPEMPYATITLLSTLPTLIAVPTGLMAGAIIKKNVNFKWLVFFSILLVLIGGCIPYFITSFASWIIARCIFGVGFGLVSPIGATMNGMFYTGRLNVRVQGMGAVVQNVFGVIMQLLAGWVCLYNVDYVWLVHLIFLAPLIVFMIGCPNKGQIQAHLAKSVTAMKADTENAENSLTDTSTKKSAIPGKVWAISIVFGIGFTCVFGFLLNVATYMQMEGIGNSAMAGIVAALYPVGGVAAGILFPTFRKVLRRALLPVMTFSAACAMLIGYLGQSVGVLCFASFLLGFSMLMLWPANIVKINGLVKAENMGLANGIYIGVINVFTFLASFFIQIVLTVMGDNTRNPVIVGAIGLLIIGIFWVFANLKKEF